MRVIGVKFLLFNFIFSIHLIGPSISAVHRLRPELGPVRSRSQVQKSVTRHDVSLLGLIGSPGLRGSVEIQV